MPRGFIPAHGGYANLLSYRKTQIIYDATIRFCDRCVAGGTPLELSSEVMTAART